MILTHWHKGPWRFDPNRKYQPQSNGDLDTGRLNDKPWGLWLSNESTYGWREWCNLNDFREYNLSEGHTFDVDMSKILVIDTGSPSVKGTIEAILRKDKRMGACWDIDQYELPRTNWALVAERWSGVYVDEGAHELFYNFPLELRTPSWLNYWDCASACVWNLDCIKQINKREAA